MRKIIVIVALLSLIHISDNSLSQDSTYFNYSNFGLGVGIDYGGIGCRLTYLPVKYFALFGSVGSCLIGFGYNVGATFPIIPDQRVCPNFSVMYGYNAFIKIKGASEYNKIYYGPSLSLGIEIRAKKRMENYFNLELILPFRPKEFTDDLDVIKNDPDIKIYSEPLPILFSIGYHFGVYIDRK